VKTAIPQAAPILVIVFKFAFIFVLLVFDFGFVELLASFRIFTLHNRTNMNSIPVPR
jgi:hypothetical protein